LLRHQSEREKRIGDVLLIGHHFGIERANAVGLALQGDFQNWCRNADACAQFVSDSAFLAGRPMIDISNAGEDCVDRCRIGVGELLAGDIKLPVRGQAGGVRQRAGAGCGFGSGKEWIP